MLPTAYKVEVCNSLNMYMPTVGARFNAQYQPMISRMLYAFPPLPETEYNDDKIAELLYAPKSSSLDRINPWVFKREYGQVIRTCLLISGAKLDL